MTRLSYILCISILTKILPIQSTNTEIEELTQWLRNKGGILNSKLQTKSTTGLYSKTKIPKNELLLKVPAEYLISHGLKVGDEVLYKDTPSDITSINPDLTFVIGDGEETVDYKYIQTSNGESVECDSVRNLLHEMELGDESEYAPYLNYLLSRDVKVPSDWSNAGKSALLEIVGDILPPYTLQTKWESECNIKTTMKIPPLYKNLFIPFFDMLQFNNEESSSNAVLEVSLNTGVTIHATRDIEADEGLSIPFNYCSNCKELDVGSSISTPDVFRDYGVVEAYPQRWFFQNLQIAFEIYSFNQEKTLKWIQTGPRHSYQILKQQFNRLLSYELDENIPEYDMLSQYTKSLLTALNLTTTTNLAFECNDEYDFTEYQTLEIIETPYQVMSFKYNQQKNDTCLYLGGIHQNRSEDVLQQCENYRPHYHEIFVHYAGRFLKDVKRVIWVGGGDSMLLNEILKYSSLELVIGLEIDQTVTRKSFQYFGTNPNYHNPKVQWWYGDAAKSLLVIPKEWYGTFDLVLVDLSETVLSMSVCKELDIMSALGLLLKPDGVLVKNDEYFQQLADVFDYTVQLEVDIPVPNPYVCILPIILASNSINFLEGFREDHAVDSLWKNHYLGDMKHDIWFDYKKNFTERMTCQQQMDIEEELVSESKSPGILMILDAEEIGVDLYHVDGFVDLLEKGIKDAGLDVIKVFKLGNGDTFQMFLLLKQGYINARAWPALKYCAFDIHLWSSFDKHEAIKASLLKAISSQQISSYRIVAGGLYGTDTWDDDLKNRGPKFTQPCDDDNDSNTSSDVCEDGTCADKSDLVDVITRQTLDTMIPEDTFKVVVVCGEEDCNTLDTVKKDHRTEDVLELKSCTYDLNICIKQTMQLLEEFTTNYESRPNVQKSKYQIGDRIKTKIGEYGNMYFGTIHYMKSDGTMDVLYDNGVMEYNVKRKHVSHLTQGDIIQEENKIRAIIIDPKTAANMGMVFYEIFKFFQNREKLLCNNIIIIVVTRQDVPKLINWKGVLNELHSSMYETDDSVFHSHVLFTKEDAKIDLSITSSGDYFFTERLKELSSIVDKRGISADIRQIYRQELVKHTNIAERFYPSDYNTISSSEQYYAQKALGRQTIFQLEQYEMVTRMLNSDDIVVEGDNVEVYFEDYDTWYPGVVISIDEEDYFDVKFADGDEDDEVERDMVRKTFIHPSNDVLDSMVISNALKAVCSKFDHESFDYEVGDGSIHATLWKEGGVVVSWDGKSHVDINLFSYDQEKGFHDDFVQMFEKEIPSLNVALSDTQPRGIGRVINFSKDVEMSKKPLWVQE